MTAYKVYKAPDGTTLYESPTGSIYRTEAEVVDNEINVALDRVTGTPADQIRLAAKNPATADPQLVAAFGVLNEVFAQAAIAAASAPAPAAPAAAA
jgi:hypothetical protein